MKREGTFSGRAGARLIAWPGAWPVGLLALLLVGGCATKPVPLPDPLTAEERNDLGVAEYVHGNYARAAEEFSRALERRPGWARALTNLGDTRLAQGDLEGAIQAYEDAHRQSPSDAATANNLAWALLQHPTRWPEAAVLIHETLTRGPEPRGYYLDTLGTLLLKEEHPREALGAFQCALRAVPATDVGAHALILRHLAMAQAQLGAAEQPTTARHVGDVDPLC